MEVRAAVVHTDVTGMKLSNEHNVRLLQQFAQRLINAQEDERQRISQEMHDDLGNRIALLALSVRHIIKQYSANSNFTLSELQNVFQQIMEFSTTVRELSHGLHPLLLRHTGIRAGLKSLQEKLERTHGIRMNLVVPEELPRLPDEVALCIFRVAQESLQNVVKHSGAERVTVVLARARDRIRLTVSDTGGGFVRSAAIEKGLGLPSMEARALSVGGCLTVNSSPGSGTEICLTVPFQDGV
jgi:signal transduction histidine kinase